MIVYGDILLIENMLMGGAVIYITGQIFGSSFRNRESRMRFAAGCIMCGIFSLIIFFPAKMPVTVLLEAGFALAVSFTVYGKVRLMQRAAAFFLVTWFMGGMTMALLLITGNHGIYTAAGIYTGDMKAPVLAVFTALCMVTAKQTIKLISRKKAIQQHCFNVTLVQGNISIKAAGFLDTGNQLREPFSGRPVAVAEESLWQEIEKKGMLCEDRFCVLPYQTVGNSGILMAARMDRIEIEGRSVKGCVIAKGAGAFDLGSQRTEEGSLLLSREMIEGIC